MEEFGEFEVLRELAAEQTPIVYLAQKKGDSQKKLFALKLFPSPASSEQPDQPQSCGGAAVETFRGNVLKAITAQKKAAERAPRHIAPVFDSGADARGVWYVTEHYPQGPLKKWISRGSGINAVELRHIVESVLAGLVAFKRHCGRSHGNLHAGNIFLRGESETPLQHMRVLLDQPCRGSEVQAGQFELDDIGALGQVIYQLVCQPQVGGFGEIIFPIFGSESWTKLGRDGEFWRELCNELLDPALSLETTSLGKLAAQVGGMRLRVARVLSGAVIVLVCAIGLFAWRDGGKDSRLAEVFIKPAAVEDSAGAKSPAQAPPFKKALPTQIIKVKPVMAEVANTNRPPRISDIEDQTTEQNRATNSFLLTVKAGNTPPVISRIEDQAIAQDKSLELAFSLNDKETAPERLSLTKWSSNPFLIPESNIELQARGTNGRVRISPAQGQTGESTIRLTVRDGQAETSTDFVVHVSPGNTPPTITAIEDQTTEQGKTIELTFAVGDKETPGRDLMLTKISSDPSLVPERNIVIGRSDTSGVLRITPAANQSGSSRITLVVTDGSLSATNSFLLTVKAGNTSPVISRIEDQTIAQDKSLELAFSLSDKETAPERLSLTKWSSNPFLIPESNIELEARGTNGRVRISPAQGQTGESTIRLTVRDGQAETSTDFVVRVSPGNTPPTITAIEDQTTEQGKTIELTFTVGDKETPARDLILTRLSSDPALVPERAIVVGRSDTSGVLRITPTANQSGSSRVTLVVTDGSLSATNSFLLTVKAGNTPPLISRIEDQTMAQDKSIELAFSLSDKETAPERLSLTKWSSNPFLIPESNIELNARGTNGRVRISPAQGQIGESTIRLTLSDGQAETSTGFVVRVSPGDTPPTITATEDQTTEQGKTIELTFTVGDKETPARDLTLTKFSSDPALVPERNIVIGRSDTSGVLRITPTANQSGSSRITLVVTDGSLSATNSFLLTVKAGNTPPLISRIEDQTMAQDNSLELAFSLNDKETAPERLSLTKWSSNPFLIPESNIELQARGTNGRVRISPAQGQIGESRIRLTVSDGQAETSTDFVARVSPVNTPPTISAIEDQTTEQGKTIELAFTVGDKETPARDLMVTKISSDPSLVPERNILIDSSGAPAALRITPAAHQSGTSRITLVVSDGSLIATNSFLLAVKAADIRPGIPTLVGQSTDQNKLIEPIALGVPEGEIGPGRAEPVGESLKMTALATSNSKTYGAGAVRALVIDPVPTRTNEARIEPLATDGALISTNTFVFPIRPKNAPPIISQIKDQTTEQDKPVELALSVSDKETPVRRLRITKSSSNPLLVPEKNIVLSGSGERRTLKIIPADQQTGTAEITVSVNDGSARVGTSFQLEVTPRRLSAAVSTLTNSIGMEFVKVGPYWIGKYEVTPIEYERLSPLDGVGLRGKHEPANVTWNDAMTFCGQLTFAEQEAKSPLGKGWIYTLLTTNEWSAIMADENFASLGVHRKTGANTPVSVREWSFSADEDLRAPASFIRINQDEDRIRIDEFGEDEKDAVHAFRCVLVPRKRLLASQEVSAQPPKRRKREAPKTDGWEELLRARMEKKF